MKLVPPIRIAVLLWVCGIAAVQAQNPPGPPPPRVAPNVIEALDFRGLRSMPTETARALLVSQAGAVYDEAAVREDFRKLWDTRRFDDVRVEKINGVRGGVILRFTVTERSPR